MNFYGLFIVTIANRDFDWFNFFQFLISDFWAECLIDTLQLRFFLKKVYGARQSSESLRTEPTDDIMIRAGMTRVT